MIESRAAVGTLGTVDNPREERPMRHHEHSAPRTVTRNVQEQRTPEAQRQLVLAHQAIRHSLLKLEIGAFFSINQALEIAVSSGEGLAGGLPKRRLAQPRLLARMTVSNPARQVVARALAFAEGRASLPKT